MKILLSTARNLIIEIGIIIGLIFLLNNCIGYKDDIINSDGVGYHEYLPSLIIHNDLIRKNDSVQLAPELYERINLTGVYSDVEGFKVNKYPCGTAVLQAPFFAYAYLNTELNGDYNDGYQESFQNSVFYAAIFYLFLSILFLRKILILYEVNKYVIAVCQILLVFGTSATFYSAFDSSFSHIYSLFAITSFIYFIKSYIINEKRSYFLISSILLGLIVILRAPNILILLFIPFLAGSKAKFIELVKNVFGNIKRLISGLLLFSSICFIQMFLWYLQAGSFFIDSYPGEGFNFLDPHFYDILFSYKKGFFVYTPFLFFASLSLIWFAVKKQYFLLISWLLFFVTITYVFSSWWSWFYGCSFGSRVYVDYYAIFFIIFALMLNEIKRVFSILIITLSVLFIPINIIQTYQYKEFILHWLSMDKENYWKIFLKTEKKYKGLIWIKQIDESHYSTISEINIGDICLFKDADLEVFSVSSKEIPSFNEVSVIQVLIDNDFEEKNDAKIVLTINKKKEHHNYYWHERHLIAFAQEDFNTWQSGLFSYQFNSINDTEEKNISVEVKSENTNNYFKNVRMRFLRKNN